jgi:hypothetical protein
MHKSVLAIRNDEADGQKVGLTPDAERHQGWLAAAYDGLLFVQSHRLDKQAAYPDGGCHAEIFAAQKALDLYIELELLSPLRELKPGESLADDAIWQIVPLPKERLEDPERAAEVARKAHETALNILAEP